MNYKKPLKKSAIALAVSATTLLSCGFVYAQDAADLVDGLEEVVVTGSRLNTNPNLTSPVPVLSVGQQEIDSRGTIRIEDLINTIPSVSPGQTGEVSNTASGTASLNLRGLGAIRTLALVDGRRLPLGSSRFAPPNIDVIPSQLIERVDLLTGGASAVYGSDAISGVANFVLKKDFEGFDLDIQGGFAQASNSNSVIAGALTAGGVDVPGSTTDGENRVLSLTWGNNFSDGRGNVTLFASYEEQDEIVQANRISSACTLGANSDPSANGGLACIGSGNFRLFGGPDGNFFQQENGTFIPFAAGPDTTFNFGASNFFQRPSERLNLYASGNYELTDNLELYSSASYVDNVSDAQIAPTASFGGGQFDVNCDNPFINAGTGLALRDIFGCNTPGIDGALPAIASGITAVHRNVEGGPRNSERENSTLRLESGLRGSIGDNWEFDVFALYAETDDRESTSNDFVTANFQQSLFATTDASGNIVCVDQSNGCVPYNIFQRAADGSSLVSQESLDFIQGVGIVDGETEQISFGGTIQTDLGNYGVSSPWSDAGIGVLFGLEYREDSLETVPDEISQIAGGGFTGVGGATLPVAGEVEVSEFFFEAQIPLITDRTFAQELTLSTQYRFSDYETDGNGISNSFDTDTYGISLNWTPADDVSFRGQFQRAVRAPNVIELFEGQDQGLGNLAIAGINANGTALNDPCASSAPLLSFDQCALTGVTAAQFGTILDVISGQAQTLTGGNPLLEPESSDTLTFGVVITPKAIPNLSITVDYFDIEVEDTILDGIPSQVTLDTCLASGDPTFCGLITRAPSGTLASGGPGFGFQSTNLNIAELATSGVDLQVSYSFETDRAGSFDLNYASTFLDTFDLTPFPGGQPIECAGNFGTACAFDVNPDYRHVVSVGWETPWNINASLSWRFNSSVDNINDAAPAVDAELDSVNYFDLSTDFSFGENFSVRAGILNATDEEPPVSISAGAPFGNGNTFPGLYDTGRSFFLGLNYSY